MAKSKLEYWSGSAWVQAKTIDFGQGTQNALLSLDLEDSLNNSMKAKVMLSNAAQEPFSSDTAADRYGPLTNVFTDFMPVRIIETESNVVLFSGKLYDIKNIYDKQYGNVVKLYARDNLAEIADYPTDDKDAPIAVTTSQRRSDLIKLIIRDTATNPLRSSLNISSSNIDYGDATKFTASARTFDEADEYTISGLSRQGLKAIHEIAKNDPHESSGEVADFGYDYYVDSQYTVSASYTAAADFNYFKRSTRTPFNVNPAVFLGAWIEYPITSTDFSSGLKQLMFPDYDFNLPKRDLYTGASAAISREHTANGETFSVNFNLEMEILEGTVSGGNSGVFSWKDKQLVRLGDNVTADSEYAETLTSGGNTVGRVQYQSTASGTGYLLISFEPDVLTDTTLSIQKKNFNALTGTPVLTGAISGATFTFNTTSGRPSKAFGLSKPLRIPGNDAKKVDSMRRRVASALSRSKITRTDCTVRTLPPPFTYIDTTVHTVDGATSIRLDTNVFSYGFRAGMTIAKIDANGNQTAYGYASTVVTDTVTVTALNTGSWTSGGDYSGTVRVYIPVRASHYIYAKNLIANFTGYMFLKSVVYTEGIGAQATQYKGTGVNTAGLPIGLGNEIDPTQASIESEGGKYPREMTVPMGSLGWTYRPIDATNRATFSSVDRDTISWTGGEMVIGQMMRFKIRASDSGNMTTSIDSKTGYPYIYKIIFDPDQSPDGSGTYNFQIIREDQYYPDMDHIILGHTRAAKLSTGDALLIFDGTGMGVYGGVDAAGEDQFSAALFKKTLQPYTTTMNIFVGNSSAANKQRYIHATAGVAGTSTNGTISFADNTTIDIEYTNSLDLGTANSIVYYIYYKLVDSSNNETADFTEVDAAEIERTTTYSYATSDSRGLLAICSTGANAVTTSPYDEIAIQAFHGKGQNITADVIAANAIIATAIKAESVEITKLNFTPLVSTNTSTAAVVATIRASTEGLVIQGNKIEINGSTIFTSGWRGTGAGENETYLPKFFAQSTFPIGDTDTSNHEKIAIGDIWLDTDDGKIYRADAASNASFAVANWVSQHSGDGIFEPKGGDATMFSSLLVNVPTSNAQYDLWLTTDTHQLFIAMHPTENNQITSGEWTLRNDADAINNASTSIDGGLIKTQRIKLLDGGALAANMFETTQDTFTVTNRDGIIGGDADDLTLTADAWASGDLYIYAGDTLKINNEELYVVSHNVQGTSFTVERAYNNTNRQQHTNQAISKKNYDVDDLTSPHIIMDNYGIVGYSNAYTPEFSLRSTDGKGVFGGGAVTAGAGGLQIGNDGGTASGMLNFDSSASGLGFIQRYWDASSSRKAGTMIISNGQDIVLASTYVYGGDHLGSWFHPISNAAYHASAWESVTTQKVNFQSTNINYAEYATISAPPTYSSGNSTTARYTIMLPQLAPTGDDQVLQTSGGSPYSQLVWVDAASGGGGGVTSIVAGNYITISGATGAVTVNATPAITSTSNGYANRVALYDDATTLKGDSGLQYNPSTDILSVYGTLAMSYASTKVIINTFGLFKYAADGGGGTPDVLAFASDQQFPTSGSPAAGTDRSSFWVMQSEAGRLIFEPIVSYSTTANNAWIGWHNNLVGIRSYYHMAGDGTESYPSFNFMSDSSTGFRLSVASPARLTAVTDGDDVASFDDNNGFYIHKIGSGGGNVDLHIVSSTGQVIKNTSSKRFKNNIADLNFDSNILYQLRPVSFDWKDGQVYENRHDFGLIAEEVDELIPEMVGHDADGQASAVNYAKLSVLLLEEVKKLRKEIDEIKEKI